MDPITRLWMFENWAADQMAQAELAKNHAYLLGSFWNPEAVKKMVGDPSNTHVSSETDYEKSLEMVKQQDTVQQGKPKRKRKRKLKD
jgi:hypothetical protein